jgi:hypothetical protein
MGRHPKPFTTVDLEMKEAPALLVELGSIAIRQSRMRAPYIAGKARRQRRGCRHVRLPMVDRDGFHKPSRNRSQSAHSCRTCDILFVGTARHRRIQ